MFLFNNRVEFNEVFLHILLDTLKVLSGFNWILFIVLLFGLWNVKSKLLKATSAIVDGGVLALKQSSI